MVFILYAQYIFKYLLSINCCYNLIPVIKKFSLSYCVELIFIEEIKNMCVNEYNLFKIIFLHVIKKK